MTSPITEQQLHNAIGSFIQFVGFSDLDKRVSKFVFDPHRYDENYIRRHSIAFGLQKVLQRFKNRYRPLRVQQDKSLFQVYAFMKIVVDTSKSLSAGGLTRLRGDILGKLDPSEDLRELEHEFRCAAHFAQKGWIVETVDLENLGKHDFNIYREGVCIEVECKTIKSDTGTPIKFNEAKEFAKNLSNFLYTKDYVQNGLLLNIDFADRLPNVGELRTKYAESIVNFLKLKAGEFTIQSDQIKFEYETVRIQKIASCKTNGELVSTVKSLVNGRVFCEMRRGKPCVIVIRSFGEIRTQQKIHESIKKGANQLAKHNPGFIWCHLLDAPENLLQRLHQQAESGGIYGIEEISERCFRNPHRKHVFALGFSSDGYLKDRSTESFTDYQISGQFLIRQSNVCKFALGEEVLDWI